MSRRENIAKPIFFIFMFFLITLNCYLLLNMKFNNGHSSLSADVYELQDKFMAVSENAAKAVVGITVTSIIRPKYSHDPFQDELFKYFFGIPEREFRQSGIGSGFIVDPKGYILTNEHVIQQADEITVILPDKRKFKAILCGSDTHSDLALIKIDAEELPYIELGNSDNVKPGQWALAIGNPFAIFENNPQPTVTLGIVSAIHRNLPSSDMNRRYYGDLIQTDAAINPGNSGGPLLDIDGNVIGINVAIMSKSGENAGIGFALPVNKAKRILDKLIKGKDIKYGWLGVAVQNLSRGLFSKFGLSEGKGVLVARVMNDGPADKAGIRQGDIILTFNNYDIYSVDDLINIISQTEIDTTVNVQIYRNGKTQNIEVIVGERKDTETTQTTGLKTHTSWRGITVQEPDNFLKQRYNLKNIEGVVVIQVAQNSPASEAGLQEGDVVDEINRKSITNIGDFKSATKSLEGDILIHTLHLGYVIINEPEN